MKKWMFLCLASVCLLAACKEEEEVSAATGSIYGMVTNGKTAEPLRAIQVQLYTAGREALLHSTVTYDDGHYEFEHVAPALYHVEINSRKCKPEGCTVTVEGGRTSQVDFQLEMLQSGIQGIVSDAFTRMPLRQVRLTLYDAEGSEPITETTSSDQGTYAFDALECSKSYRLTARAEDIGYEQQETVIDLDCENYRTIHFALSDVDTGLSVTTGSVSGNSYANQVTFEGQYRNTDMYAPFEVGFVYAKGQDPRYYEKKTITGSVKGWGDTFSATTTMLGGNGTYCVRAYAKNEKGISFGQLVQFEVERL